MRTILSLIVAIAVLAMLALAADPPPSSAFVKPIVATNGMWILSDDGVFYNGTNSVITWRRNVRVTDPQMYLECDLLHAYFNTNVSRLEVIVAEGRVMLVSQERQILGDRAVYTASNDVVVITGQMVALADSRVTLLGSQFVYDRKSGNAYSVGPVTTLLDAGGALPLSDQLGGAGRVRSTNAPPEK